MTAQKSEFDQRGIAVLVISFASVSTVSRYQERHRWPFAVLTDPERTSYRAFGLGRFSRARVFSLSTLLLYMRLLRKGIKREPYGGEDVYQSGGDFLLDRNGNLLYAHRSQDPADRPTVATLLSEIDRVKSAWS